jgi:hypothetical protein
LFWASAAAQQDSLPPTVISCWFKKDNFQASFQYGSCFVVCLPTPPQLLHSRYTGTRDYTAFGALSAALDFCEHKGIFKIMAYNNALARFAVRKADIDVSQTFKLLVFPQQGEYLSKLWGTECLCDDTFTAALVNVRLPTGAGFFLLS